MHIPRMITRRDIIAPGLTIPVPTTADISVRTIAGITVRTIADIAVRTTADIPVRAIADIPVRGADSLITAVADGGDNPLYRYLKEKQNIELYLHDTIGSQPMILRALNRSFANSLYDTVPNRFITRCTDILC